MSYKFILPPETSLPNSIGTQGQVEVAYSLWAYIVSNLPDSRWTMLEIRNGNRTEIIRVEGFVAPNYLITLRGRDGTIPLAFPAGSSVRYTPTAEAISGTTITGLHVTATGIVNYNEGDFYVPPLSITGLGGAVDSGNEIHTQILTMCCPANPVTPAIPESLLQYRITADNSLRITNDGSYRAYA